MVSKWNFARNLFISSSGFVYNLNILSEKSAFLYISKVKKFSLEDSDNFPTLIIIYNALICCPYRVCLVISLLEKLGSEDTMVTEVHPNSHRFPGLVSWSLNLPQSFNFGSAGTKSRSNLGYVIDQFYLGYE